MEDFEKKVSISEPMAIAEPENMEIQARKGLKQFELCREITLEFNDRLKQVGLTESWHYRKCFGCICYLGLLNGLLLLLMWNAFLMMVLEMESVFTSPAYSREDVASLLKSVQAISDTCSVSLNIMCSFFSQTATIQVLKKAGRPSERLVSHENCRYTHSTGHECMHIQQITEESGTGEAEPDSEYDNALKEAVKGIQDVVISINEYLEEVSRVRVDRLVRCCVQKDGGGTVGVVNQATGNPITVHCYSGNDDLGFKKLAFGESFSWSFRYSVLENTKYICTINTDFGSGSYVYMTYTEGFIVDKCGLNCVWIVRQDGPCLQQTQGPLLCQKWQR
ncbi:hypothetical protein SASPL_151607 [Salvia splendens]|uniref:Uncharacterized protein n=1 Tax=Salvia splendens TaxID=180675 RepID=A0A8X8W8R7_SALSN|nr:hypothetical protein SASPL_151607 [Salvia splendens]